MAVKE